MFTSSQLVAHRGLPLAYPENTLLGYEAAVAAGARLLEVDVQLTADLVPILYHDDTADRLSGFSACVNTTALAELQRYGAFHPERFGAQFRGLPVSTLTQLVKRLNEWPGVRLFLEIKTHSVEHFGAEQVYRTVASALEQLVDRLSIAALISFDDGLLANFREAGWPIGWVLPAWDRGHETRAAQLQPEYLFVDQRRVPDDPSQLWQGRWQWAVYTVNDLQAAVSWRERRWPLIETDVFDQLGKAPQWKQHDAHESV